MTQSAIVNGVVKGYEEHSLPLHIVVMGEQGWLHPGQQFTSSCLPLAAPAQTTRPSLDMEWHSMLSTTDCETFIGKSGQACSMLEACGRLGDV